MLSLRFALCAGILLCAPCFSKIFERKREAPADPNRWLHMREAEERDILVEFVTDDCAMCDKMDAAVRRLEFETGRKLTKLNVQESDVAQNAWKRIDKGGKCGGFPYFFNRRTQQRICGLSTEDNLRSLFLDEKTQFWAAPDEVEEARLRGEAKSMRSGVFGKLGGRFGKKGQEDDEDAEWEYVEVEEEYEEYEDDEDEL